MDKRALNKLENAIAGPHGLVCPVCLAPFRLTGTGVICQGGHSFDLTSPGTLNFIRKKINSREDAYYKAQAALHRMAPWQTLLATIRREADTEGPTVLTGSSLAGLMRPVDYGFEAAARSVVLQLRTDASLNLFIAEAAQLPLPTGSMELVIRLDQQTDLSDAFRVLAPGRRMVRVLPGQRHLLEVRQYLFSGRRLGLRENQPLVRSIWAAQGEGPVTARRLTLTVRPAEAELMTIVGSLIPGQTTERLAEILRLPQVTFDFQIFYLDKP